MKCSLGISNFLKEISSLSHSIVFLYFLALITEEGFLISPCYSLELCIQMDIIFPFLLCLSLWNAEFQRIARGNKKNMILCKISYDSKHLSIKVKNK